MSARQVLVPIAHGSEEIEAVTIIDTLRRAKMEVRVASVEDVLEVTCSRGVKLVADVLLNDVADIQFDVIAIPGGLKGSETFSSHSQLIEMLSQQLHSRRLVASICASPAIVLARNGLLKKQDGHFYKATCFPSMMKDLPNAVDHRVVVDGNLITSQGPGTSLEFARAIIVFLLGEHTADQVTSSMLLK